MRYADRVKIVLLRPARSLALVALLAAASAEPAPTAADWLQFHGPGGSGIAAQPRFKLVAQNKLSGDDTDFNAAPALSDRQLFLRSNRTLYCIKSVQTAGAGKTQ